MTTHPLRYGAHELLLPALGTSQVSTFADPATQLSVDPDEMIRQALEAPIGTLPLRELARGRESASILIPGRTRVAETARYVPRLLDELTTAGLPYASVRVHLATGTHEHHGKNDLNYLLGSEISARVQCVPHDCHDAGSLKSLGRTGRGTPVSISAEVAQSELVILTGRIVPHYFAGFSGGRKALVPGVAGFETIEANHRLTLAPEEGIHAGIGPGQLAGNPVHEDMAEAAALLRPEFCLNTILDSRDQLVSAVAGNCEQAFDTGCKRASKLLCQTFPEPVDLLVTSSGGLPHDCNFMQALKAVMNHRNVVRPGGAILWVGCCPGGIHPGFLQWAEVTDDDELERAVRSRYSLTGHNSIMLRELVRHARVVLYSELPPEQVLQMGLVPAASLEEGLSLATSGLARDFSTAVISRGNVTASMLDLP